MNGDGLNDPGRLSSHRSNGGGEKSSALEPPTIIQNLTLKHKPSHHSVLALSDRFLREFDGFFTQEKSLRSYQAANEIALCPTVNYMNTQCINVRHGRI